MILEEIFMDKIIEKIDKAENIIITAHISEDADAMGSAIALGTALRSVGKKATVLLSEKPEDRLEFLDFDYEIFSEDFSAQQDLLICLDTASEERLGKRAVLLEKSESVVLDHHYTNTRFGDYNYVDGDASSTGELVFRLLKKMNIQLTKEIAVGLYAAISGDTGSFQYSCTSPETMRIVAELMETGIDHAEIARNLYDLMSPELIKLNGYVMSNIKSYFEGKLSMVTLTNAEFESFGVSEKNSGDIVNIARKSKGAEIAISVRETPEKIKISFRSNGKYNVSDIATHFGGGGHKMAAGAKIVGKPFCEACEEIVRVCGEFLND